jgi:hypothetical protein
MSKNRPDFAPQPTQANRPAPGAAAPAAPEQTKPKPKAKPKSPSPWPWGLMRRLAVSALVLLHLTAVISAPWFLLVRDLRIPATPPGMPVRDAQGRVLSPEQFEAAQIPVQAPTLPYALYRFFIHYANLIYINNGYDFFSPDPVPNQLIRYTLYNSAGENIGTDTFPDLKSQWPRLFYHRHMMLASQLGEFDRETGEEGLRLIGRRLLATHPGAYRVRVDLAVHELLTPQQVLDGKPLNASETYQPLRSIDEYAPPAEQQPPRAAAAGWGSMR